MANDVSGRRGSLPARAEAASSPATPPRSPSHRAGIETPSRDRSFSAKDPLPPGYGRRTAQRARPPGARRAVPSREKGGFHPAIGRPDRPPAVRQDRPWLSFAWEMGQRLRGEKLMQRLDRLHDAEFVLHANPARFAEPRAQLGIAHQSVEGFGKLLPIPRRNEQPGDAIDDGFGDSRQLRGDDRPRAGHRFQDHGWKNVARAIAHPPRRPEQKMSQLCSLEKTSS